MPLGFSRTYRASMATRKEFVERDGGARYIMLCGGGYFQVWL